MYENSNIQYVMIRTKYFLSLRTIRAVHHVEWTWLLPAGKTEEFTNASDIDIRHIGENVEVGSSKPWFQGRRVVELDVLARSMNCEKCNSWLLLSDIVDEVVYGMASYLYITCQNSVCRHISLVPTGKKSSKRGFDINYKVYLGN